MPIDKFSGFTTAHLSDSAEESENRINECAMDLLQRIIRDLNPIDFTTGDVRDSFVDLTETMDHNSAKQHGKKGIGGNIISNEIVSCRKKMKFLLQHGFIQNEGKGHFSVTPKVVAAYGL